MSTKFVFKVLSGKFTKKKKLNHATFMKKYKNLIILV